MGSEEFVKKEYESELKGPNRKGRPLGRWRDKVEECVSEGKWTGVSKEGMYG